MSDFDGLPVWLQRQVDAAFDQARVLPPDPVCTGLVPAAAEKSRPGHDEGELTNYHSDDEQFSEGGGFLVEDKPGGFLPAEGNTADFPGCRSDNLGLSMIPAALQYLDLPPDDEDVLATFRSAAGGWGEAVEGEQAVSRRDWREVCAILVKGRIPSRERNGSIRNSYPRGESHSVPEEDQDMDALIDSDLDDSEDEYQSEDHADETSSAASSDDEYGLANGHNGESRGRRGRSNRPSKRQQSSSASNAGTPLRLTPRQRREARKTFALFFPDVPSERLESQRIMIKDISRVASLLSIKLKAEEIIEMLEAFATSPDKSIGLTEFESLVMTARLV